jgi:GH15 family glucan-1,4-alpha-glucosidase
MDGQFPVKLYSMDVVTRFFHSWFGREQPIENMLRPKYKSAHGAPSLDGQALLLIAAVNYVEKTGDMVFLRKYWEQLQLGMKWLEGFRRNPAIPLLHQGAFADWADSVARRGYVLYTNVIYWRALCDMSLAATILGLEPEAQFYEEEAHTVADAIQQRFWMPELGYFKTSDRLDQLSSDGNLLAVAWGLTQPAQAESILQVMKERAMAEPVPTRAAYPGYPAELIALENYLGGLSNYHTSAAWLWLGAWHAIALVKAAQPEEAHKLLLRISEVIVRDQQVNEAHGPNGRPLASTFYHFESPLTWNAGMVVYAYHVYETSAAASGLLSLFTKKR